MRNGSIILSLAWLQMVLLLSATPVKAENAEFSAQNWVINNFNSIGGYLRVRDRLTKLAPVNSIKQKYLEYFDQSDYGFDGITQEEIDIKKLERQRRANARGLNSWFLKDINQDLKVTKKELEIYHLKQAARAINTQRVYIAKTREQIVQILNELVARDLIMDSNKDNEITIDEAIANIKAKQSKKFFRRGMSHLTFSMALDLDGNQKIEREEFKTIIDNTISLVDKNKDGFISEDEYRNKIDKTRSKDRKLRPKHYRRINLEANPLIAR